MTIKPCAFCKKDLMIKKGSKGYWCPKISCPCHRYYLSLADWNKIQRKIEKCLKEALLKYADSLVHTSKFMVKD